MSYWNKLLSALGFHWTRKRSFNFDEELVKSLRMLAELEQRSENEVAADLLSSALARHTIGEDYLRRWEALSAREQQVVSLLVLDYTNRQIAAALSVSVDTVKSHVAHALHKFDMHSRSELRKALQGWEMDAWRKANLGMPFPSGDPAGGSGDEV